MSQFQKFIKHLPTFFAIGGNIVTLAIVSCQLRENIRTNEVSIAGQLYELETKLALDEEVNPSSKLSTIWAVVPPEVTGQQYAARLLGLVTDEKTARNSRNATQLYHNMFDAKVFADKKSRDATRDLRRLFLYAENSFYHVHMAFDYKEYGILDENEWRTWKGMIRDMHAHPILLAFIWHGYQNHYFSKAFARFLQKELCSDPIPSDVTDKDDFRRGRDFIQHFYPDMMDENWPNGLPEYE